MATISEYIKSRPRRPMAEWADELGISRPFLIALMNGDRSPSFEVARNIAARTDGQVGIQDWPRFREIIAASGASVGPGE